jgi:hypothetical protein
MSRSLRSKLLLMRFTELDEPIGIRFHGIFDQRVRYSDATQVRPHAQGPLAPSGMVRNEVLHVAAVIDQLFDAQALDQLRHQGGIVTLDDQFAP